MKVVIIKISDKRRGQGLRNGDYPIPFIYITDTNSNFYWKVCAVSQTLKKRKSLSVSREQQYDLYKYSIWIRRMQQIIHKRTIL